MPPDIVPGAVFPDHRLPDHTRTVRTLGELQGDDPMVRTLARGHHCPEEHQQHLEPAAFQSRIAVAYTQVVTISTDDHHGTQEFRASVGATWTFLSNPGRIVQRDLDTREYTDPEHDLKIPHTLVLEPTGTSPRPGCGRPGTPATGRGSTGGTADPAPSPGADPAARPAPEV